MGINFQLLIFIFIMTCVTLALFIMFITGVTVDNGRYIVYDKLAGNTYAMAGVPLGMDAKIIAVDKSGGQNLKVVFRENYGTDREYMCNRLVEQNGHWYVKTKEPTPIAILPQAKWALISAKVEK